MKVNFVPRCNGLVLLETYSALDNGALEKCLPKFLTLVEEVTGNPAYSMFNLSLREEWNKTTKFCRAFQGILTIFLSSSKVKKAQLFSLRQIKF